MFRGPLATPTSPATSTSKLPRFLQSAPQHDRSKSLSIDQPPSAASSASHGTTTSYTSNTSNSTSARFLGLGKDKERECTECRRALDAVRVAANFSPTSYDFAPSSPPSATQAAGTDGNRATPNSTLARSPSRLSRHGRPAGATTAKRVVCAFSGPGEHERLHHYCTCIFHAAGKKSNAKSEDSHNANAKSTSKVSDTTSKTSLLDNSSTPLISRQDFYLL
ncbi:hypothetical protein B0H13DRAFT_2579024 [Mycena leptocephala]|nr:hypothetical protein B0H13DRAFT_2579024 [Mycena leptocephala]